LKDQLLYGNYQLNFAVFRKIHKMVKQNTTLSRSGKKRHNAVERTFCNAINFHLKGIL